MLAKLSFLGGKEYNMRPFWSHLFLLLLSSLSIFSCMYISGMPGVGKMALVSEVVQYLQEAVDRDMLPAFKFVEVNGMKVTDQPKIFISIVTIRMSGNIDMVGGGGGKSE